MVAATPTELLDAIRDAIEQSGASCMVAAASRHPRQLVVIFPDSSRSLWVYIWNLTFGGRKSLQDEFRIQMTSVDSPLPLNPKGDTVLMGYHADLKVFAGFDLRRHRTFTAGSPSVQIEISALRDAVDQGLALHRKANDEIAVGVGPEQFLAYVENAEELHSSGGDSAVFRLLRKATALKPIPASALNKLSGPRKRLVQTVSRLQRDSNFERQVLGAYGHRCAVTRIQLRLLDAAHILPVAVPGSPDHVTNGIALSPTYHRAFDRGLIYLDRVDGDFHMRLNDAKLGELASLHLEGGMETLSAALGKIHHPPDKGQWPSDDYVREANRHRKIGA